MKRSTDHILSSNAGTLPRPEGLLQLLDEGPDSVPAYIAALPAAVNEVVRKQIDIGIDVVNDGEYSKRGGFQGYIRERMSGIEQRPVQPGEVPPHGSVSERDLNEFPEYYAKGIPGVASTGPQGASTLSHNPNPIFCTGPLEYIGAETVRADIATLLAAVAGFDVEPYLPVVSPGNVEHWLWNLHYPDNESFLTAIADMLHEEYKPIADAGIVLQIDDPDLADGWQMYPEMSFDDYRKYAELRVEALNYALRDVPEDLVRFHVCWGSSRGPHKNDLPLKEIVDVMLRVKAECYSVEAANVRHEHEWQLWENVKLPEGKSLMPGVVSHVTDHVEHPELVAWRIKQYANLVGRENVIAGTDCGMARARPGELCWAKLEAMTAGARLATEELWRH
jgi:5-methyltetrahydropteroyltriglutamate--homocysteine methyltransferase